MSQAKSLMSKTEISPSLIQKGFGLFPLEIVSQLDPTILILLPNLLIDLKTQA
jgi:hypothetical protein